jgi:hypothetical protein
VHAYSFFEMLRRIRRELALIRYYSAHRPVSPWDAALRWAVLLALVFAPLAVFLTDRMVARGPTTLAQVHGRLWTEADGSIWAELVAPERAFDPIEAPVRSDFLLSVRALNYGLPFPSSRLERPATVDFVYADRVGETSVVLAAGEPRRRAIEAALRREDLNRILEAFTRSEPHRAILSAGWIAGVIVWWFALALVLVAVIRLAQLAYLIARQKRRERRHERRQSGLCHRCGYDLRGLEFSGRCPECGAIME